MGLLILMFKKKSIKKSSNYNKRILIKLKKFLLNYKFPLSIIFALAVLTMIFHKVNWKIFFEALRNANITILILGFSLTLLYPVFCTLRWLWVIKALNQQVPIYKVLKSVMMAFSANILLPGKAGDLLKAYPLRKNMPISHAISGVIAERVGDVLSLMILGLVGAFCLQKWHYLLIVTIILMSGLTAIFIVAQYDNKIKSLNIFAKSLSIIIKSAYIWKASPSRMLFSLFWSMMCWITACIQVWIFFQALHVSIPLITIVTLFPLIIFISLLPITFGGLGVREMAFAYFFCQYTFFSINIEVGLLYFISNYILLALLGLLFFNHHTLSVINRER